MQRGTLFSFIYYEDGQIIYDELPPENRFQMTLMKGHISPLTQWAKALPLT